MVERLCGPMINPFPSRYAFNFQQRLSTLGVGQGLSRLLRQRFETALFFILNTGAVQETNVIMTIDEMIAVLQAAKAGKQIQFRWHSTAEWKDMSKLVWDFENYNYRVKPEPREWWIMEGALQREHPRHDFNEEYRYRMRKVREVLE
jgi:hypothetical protein